MNNCAYQSPIELCSKHSLNLECCILKSICGHNCGSTYDKEHKIFIVSDDIYLSFNNQKYRLYEYHYHIPAEHKIDGIIYPSEIHYVYLKEGFKYNKNIIDICGDNKIVDSESSILAIGFGIENRCDKINLNKMKIYKPSSYYLYDGSLTTPNYGPVKWIVSKDTIRLNIDQLISISKNARELQNTNNRIILFHDCS